MLPTPQVPYPTLIPSRSSEPSASQSLGKAGESCSIRGDHAATPSPASPPNTPASLGSPGHRGQAGGPRPETVYPQGHMESPNTITPQEAEPLKRASGWALSDPARLHPHKRGCLETQTHMEEFHRPAEERCLRRSQPNPADPWI